MSQEKNPIMNLRILGKPRKLFRERSFMANKDLGMD